MAGIRKHPPIIDATAWNDLIDYLAGESTEARLHPLRKAHPIASAATYVVFAFDDGLVSQYTEAYPRLAARGWRATAFIMPNFIGSGGYITEAQVKALRDAGWEIGNHTTNGPAFNTLTRAEIEDTVRDAKNWIEQKIEAPCLSFCYPEYIYLDKDGVSAKDLVARYHPYGCQGTGTGWDGYPSQSILRQGISNANHGSVSTWINEAKGLNKSLILFCHSIGTGGEDITPSNFEAVLDAVAASACVVLPLREVAAKYGFPFAMWPEKKHIHGIQDHDYVDTLGLHKDWNYLVVPLNAGWTADCTGSGAQLQAPMQLRVSTGTTASSRGGANTFARGLNSGGLDCWQIDFDKRIEMLFQAWRDYSDAQAVGRLQLKTTGGEGALTDKGFGLEIANLAVTGEAYGTARSTVALGSLTLKRTKRFRIVHIPGSKVEFYVDDALAGTLTGTAVPSGSTPDGKLVLTIINGAAGGVNAQLGLVDLKLLYRRA